ncbi:hypothetical protein M2C31_11640, partial [Klebsiella pneumoniae]|nr:hypothetical protein [Klebsiella pneumoniae]MDZ0578677.1 hypothetical protein [Klebsiella pneumoniae]MDZ3020325.1 hypothetical protein [Klebsiella pneumoniae]
LLCHGTVCVVGKIRDLILQLSKSSIYSTKPQQIPKNRNSPVPKNSAIHCARKEPFIVTPRDEVRVQASQPSAGSLGTARPTIETGSGKVLASCGNRAA